MPDTAQTAVPGAENDPGAPYGRNLDGSPKKGPGGRPAGKKSTRTRASRATARPASPGRTSKPNTPRAKPVDRSETAEGLVQLFAGGLGVAARTLASRKPSLAQALQLDALTLHMKAGEAGSLVNDSAKELPWLGAALDRWTAYTPWAKPTMFLAGLAAQFAVNHGMAEPGMLGSVSPEEVIVQAMATAPEGAPTPRQESEPPEPEYYPATPEQYVDMKVNGQEQEQPPEYVSPFVP